MWEPKSGSVQGTISHGNGIEPILGQGSGKLRDVVGGRHVRYIGFKGKVGKQGTTWPVTGPE